MSIKDFVLNKGWAGTTIGRQETAERLNVLLRSGIELLHRYNAVAATDPSRVETEELQKALSILRADIGKLSESVFSCGAVAYSGVDLDPSEASTEGGWNLVVESEKAFFDQLMDESEVEHQIRTRAIIGAVAKNSEARAQMLRETV